MTCKFMIKRKVFGFHDYNNTNCASLFLWFCLSLLLSIHTTKKEEDEERKQMVGYSPRIN